MPAGAHRDLELQAQRMVQNRVVLMKTRTSSEVSQSVATARLLPQHVIVDRFVLSPGDESRLCLTMGRHVVCQIV